jgi:cytidine deaminase
VTGANVENASYGLTICPERSALVRAIAERCCQEAIAQSKAAGVEEAEKFPPACITAIATAGPDGHTTISPCGACRQVLRQFATKKMSIMFWFKGRVRTADFREPVPAPFELKPHPSKQT